MSETPSLSIAAAQRAVFAALAGAPHGAAADKLAGVYIAAADAAQNLNVSHHARIDALTRALAFEIDSISPDSAGGDRAGRAALDAAFLLARGHFAVLRIDRAERARAALTQTPSPESKEEPSA